MRRPWNTSSVVIGRSVRGELKGSRRGERADARSVICSGCMLEGVNILADTRGLATMLGGPLFSY